LPLSNIDIVSGITGLEIIICGYLLGIKLLRQRKHALDERMRKKLTLSGIFIIVLYHSWFSVASGFLLLALGSYPLGQVPSILGYAWGPAIGIPIWTFLAFNRSKEEENKYFVTGLVSIIGLGFFILVYTNPLQYTFYQASAVGGLPDSGFDDLAKFALVIMLLVIMLMVGPVFLNEGANSENPNNKWRNISMGAGAILFAFFAIIDAAVENVGVVSLAIIRAFIFTSVFLVYQGVEKPDIPMKISKQPRSIQRRITFTMVFSIFIPLLILSLISLKQITTFSNQIDTTMTGNLVFLFLMITGILIVIIFLVIKKITNKIVKPIHSLTQSIENMAMGNLQQEISIDSSFRDNEIGMLARSFQNLLVTMRLGNTSYYQGDMSLAFKNYSAAKELFETTKNLHGLGMCLNNLGNIYRNWGDYDKARESYNISIEIGEREEIIIASRYNNRGLLHLTEGNNRLAMEDFRTALLINKEIEDDESIAVTKRNMGILHMMQGDSEKAKFFFDAAYKINEKWENNAGLAEDIFQLARLAILEKTLEKADKFFKIALKRAESLKNYPLMENIFEEMIRLYEIQNDEILLEKAQAELGKIKRVLVKKKDVIFVIDQSGSMSDQGKMPAVRTGTLSLFNEMINPDDRVAIIGFHSIIENILELTEKKGNETKIKTVINNLTNQPYETRLYDGIGAAIDRLSKATPLNEKGENSNDRQKWLVTLTDGEDTSSQRFDYQELAEYITKIDPPINFILIGVGPEIRAAHKQMTTIVNATPRGKYIKIYSANNVQKRIEDAFKRVKQIMASSEIEGFVPENL
jgi:tetratricopeptide (TPR) repeat protein